MVKHWHANCDSRAWEYGAYMHLHTGVHVVRVSFGDHQELACAGSIKWIKIASCAHTNLDVKNILAVSKLVHLYLKLEHALLTHWQAILYAARAIFFQRWDVIKNDAAVAVTCRQRLLIMMAAMP